MRKRDKSGSGRRHTWSWLGEEEGSESVAVDGDFIVARDMDGG